VNKSILLIFLKNDVNEVTTLMLQIKTKTRSFRGMWQIRNRVTWSNHLLWLFVQLALWLQLAVFVRVWDKEADPYKLTSSQCNVMYS